MNNFKMKGKSITQGTDGHKAALKKNTIGTGFMNPPYKKQVGPTEKRSGYHGYKDFDSNIRTKPVETAKKSTVAVDGQLNDAQKEYETDKKLLAKKKSPAKAAVCGPGGKSNTGSSCGNFKVKKKGTVVSRLANKMGKKVKNTTKKITKGVTNKVKKIKKNRRLNKDSSGSNKTVRYL